MRLLAFALLFAGGCAQKSDLDAANEKIKALEEKVAKLEAGGAKGGATAADPAKEEAATKLMTDTQEALKNGDYATAKSKIAELTGSYADTRAGKAASRMAAEVNLVGTDAAPIEVEKWFQGKGDYSGDKATLLVFWEVWCPHCKKEMPKLAEEEGKYKAKGVQIVALTKVTKSATDEKVAEFIKEHNLKYPVGKEKGDNMSKAFSVSGIPAAALVKDGKVVWRGHPARLTDEMLDKLLAS
ncbi:MAG: TlpA family protein disulfide reductase [Myxococcota bacterium]